ncbi:malic enzyme-like NAD(P)-binding protein [Leptospira sp. GIMC2001]|uniref:malic enzyme-like NAD(P)-binding protein n=1 Tax=Leptospira sp. GIMC2001 TaxID=1513297 RepID=UPI00234B5530|nr:malic enzyme-like NAD(P)-binding protein [Leptospira sp. GIMC2001]WCL49728.1 malate dehydrogenase [Leptospira sp. GIMC2001]
MKEEALKYHSQFPQGKTKVVPTKPTDNSADLTLAYSPGVAYPCLEIADNKELVYEYTNKGNLVGIITNGTAVLGLGNIGPEAGKPVMEGKAVLFKKFAGIDVFDIELNTQDPEELIRAVKLLEPTFGGINLEDIKAPECFYIEKVLDENMDIPVFHDDQHGTAIITTAALLNALIINGKKLENLKVVINGAGAAAVAIADMICEVGVDFNNIFMLDSRGMLNLSRKDLHDSKKRFVRNIPENSLRDVVKGADVFIGVSVRDVMDQVMVQSMAKDPIVFALANPDPEIPYQLAKAARPDVILATGRSDHPNQVNNVLGFPFIFRGALDIRSKRVNSEMKLAASKALADLARLPVPDELCQAYGVDKIEFGSEYIIPKPFDPRLIFYISSAVAKAAVESGVAQIPYPGDEAYRKYLNQRMGISS